MACRFSINVGDGWHIIAGDDIKAAGGSFTGDVSSGDFSVGIPGMGTIRGSYLSSASGIEVTITDKPFLLPCAGIQKYVRDKFATGGK